MPDKTVLVIAYYFPPMGLSGVQRTLKFVKYLPEYGWNVIVLTSGNDKYYAFDESQLRELDTNNVKIFRTDQPKPDLAKLTKKFPGTIKQKFGRLALNSIYIPDSKIKWKDSAVKAGNSIMKKYDIDTIFATAPPFTDFLVASELAAKFQKPFIIDYRDSWVDNDFHYYPTFFHKNASIKLETKILNRAKRAIVTTRQAKEALIKRYRFLSHNDVTIITHGYDPEDFLPYKSVEPDKNKFVITHSGMFQDDRTPKYFFKALSEFLKATPDAKTRIEARFVGLMRQNHLKLIKKYSLESVVKCTGYLSHTEAVRQLMESHVLWLMLNDNIRTPGKLYEYFGAGKPIIICSPDGVIRRTALESLCATAVGSKDIEGIFRALKDFYKKWAKGELPKNDEGFSSQYDRRKLTGELAKELALATDI